MDAQQADEQGLPPLNPDIVEQELEELIDNIVPTRGYDMLPMVGIGGSAGSIPALKTFFTKMPADSGMAFVVILHLSPDFESNLSELLQRTTSMPVLQVTHREKVLANHVYVIAPGKIISSADGELAVTDMPHGRGRRVAVDLFFRTLADSHGPHSSAIVLSGVDGDGAIGIKRIKERGGLTVAQDPDEAEHSGMPRAAIGTGMVDWVLNVGDMPERLLDYKDRELRLKIPPEEGVHPSTLSRPATDASEEALQAVLGFLRNRTGRDFSYYKRATIVRRIARRMQVNGIDDLPGYLDFLRTHPGEPGALLQDLLISVTNFFRDRDAFAAIEAQIPNLFKGKTSNDTIRLWNAACATGEEAYSLAMLMVEHARHLEAPPIIQIFATDLNEGAIQAARDGVYSEAITADVSEERLRKFFVKEHRGYRIRREIRELVLFAVHDLLKDSPFSRLDLVSCRNLLIYLNRDAQNRVFDIFNFALRGDGLMFLGSSETIEESQSHFAVLDKKFRIFSRRGATRIGLPIPAGPSSLARAFEQRDKDKAGPVIAITALNQRSAPNWNAGLHEQVESLGDVHYRLLEQLGPPSLIVNAEYDILHASAHVGRFLQFGGGEPTRNLLRLVHPMLRVDLRALLYRASQSGETTEISGAPLASDGRQTSVLMRVIPVGDGPTEALLVMFEASESTVDKNGDSPRAALPSEPATQHMERELERMKALLRDTIEQYEASHEELKASNEELQAMNEELRSATEELETSREELQSINEELTTVNHELKSKVDELGVVNSDLHNLMASTAIATIFVNRGLRINRYTPAAVELFNLIPSDVGRPLTDLTHRLDYSQLSEDADRVLETLVPTEREVGDLAGNWFLARLLPYRTIEDRIAGLVLTFINISERKQAEAILRSREDELRQSNTVLDDRVQERTRELRESEARLMDAAATSNRRSQQLHELTNELTRAEQKERRRLAHILHDHVQQLLVAARMRLEMLRSDLSEESLQTQLVHVEELLNETIQVTRTLSVELAPPLLYEQGLPAALKWLAGLMEKQHLFTVTVEADEDASPSEEEELDFLFQATRELLLNIVKHAKTDLAAVRLTRGGGMLHLEVRDQGAGFTLGANFRGLASFGLFHMRERVESLGGSLVIDSVPGSGTRVSLTIPLRNRNDPAAVLPKHDLVIANQRTSVVGERIRVLLVDDHQIVREGLTQLLNRQPDIEVVGEAASGAAGVDLACRLAPDVVLMDVNMPEMNGLDAVRQIIQRMPGSMVIALSLHEDPEMAQAMLASGAIRYLTKQGGSSELLEAIRQAVANR